MNAIQKDVSAEWDLWRMGKKHVFISPIDYEQLFSIAHSGHFGRDKALQKLKSIGNQDMVLFHPESTKWLVKAIQKCYHCLIFKKIKDDDEMKQIRCIYPSDKYLIMDYTSLRTSKLGDAIDRNYELLTAIEPFSRFAFCELHTEQSSVNVIAFMKRLKKILFTNLIF